MMAKNKTPFKVEDNYFDNLEKEILAKVKLSPKKKYLFPSNKALIRYAAALLLLLSVGGMVLLIEPSDLSDASKQISQSQIIDSRSQKAESLVIDEPIVSSNETESFKNEIHKPQTQIEEQAFQELELTEEELDYLEYYLEMDVLNDYLTYNDVNL